MGWNAGGFGHMTFESVDGVAAWKAANVKHDQWNDWVDWFESPLDKSFTVAEELKKLGKFHKPDKDAYLAIAEENPKVDFLFEAGEDTFRDLSGTIAAVLRASAPHGARGTFYFLGTAGAEYDFTYKLEIANGFSTLESLHENEIATIYESPDYQQFMTTVMTALGVLEQGQVFQASPPAPVDDDAEREALQQKAAAFKASEKAAKTTAKEAAKQAAKKGEAKPVAKAVAKAVAKPIAKPVAKKAAAKPVAKKAAAKPAAKKSAAKKPAAKKPAKKK